MEITKKFKDGLYDFLSALTNKRNAAARNNFTNRTVDYSELKAIFKSGTANKIFRIKTSGALSGTIFFDSKEQEDIYNSKIAKAVKKACMFQLGFGRGIVVIHERGAILDKPLVDGWNTNNYKLDVFSGDMVTVSNVSQDLSDDRYYEPDFYVVKGARIHWTRVADFTYVEPVQNELPLYRYGGISESELIYDQLVNDGVVERSSASIVEKNSSFFYKVKGFKSMMQMGKEKDLLKYISAMEDNRSIYGAGIVDDEDEVMSISQALTNLKEVDDVSLRRLSLVTGIPVTWLVGENVKGLNSSGDNEQKIFNDMLQAYQEFYIIDVLNSLLERLGLDRIRFKDQQAKTPLEKANYDKVVLNNALIMAQIGEDYNTYLKESGIVRENDNELFFTESTGDDDMELIDPSKALNGAQVTALVTLTEKVKTGEMDVETAKGIMQTSFPMTEAEINSILGL